MVDLSEDAGKDAENSVQELTDCFIVLVDKHLAAKEKRWCIFKSRNSPGNTREPKQNNMGSAKEFKAILPSKAMLLT